MLDNFFIWNIIAFIVINEDLSLLINNFSNLKNLYRKIYVY